MLYDGHRGDPSIHYFESKILEHKMGNGIDKKIAQHRLKNPRN